MAATDPRSGREGPLKVCIQYLPPDDLGDLEEAVHLYTTLALKLPSMDLLHSEYWAIGKEGRPTMNDIFRVSIVPF